MTTPIRFANSIALILVLLWGLVGCAPAREAETPGRDKTRAAILMLARAVSVADQLCTTVALDRKDAAVEKRCADAYDMARPALVAAESAVDAWESGQRGDVACTASRAAASLRQVAESLKRAGIELPALIVDALSLSKSFPEVCNGAT